MTTDRCGRALRRWTSAPAVLLLVLLLAAPLPARCSRALRQQGGTCPDLVPGGDCLTAEVPAGGTATLAAYADVGPVYVAAEALDDASPDGPSSFSLELWSSASSSGASGSSEQQQAAAAATAVGCATTPVVDPCPAPAAVSVRVACLNSGGRPCRLRLAAYMSACPGGPPPRAVAVAGGSSGSGGDSSSSGGDSSSSAGGSSAGESSSSSSSSSSDGGGVSATTWVVVGACLGGAALAALVTSCLCQRARRRRRAAGDAEAGLSPHPPKQQQQFLVSGGGAPTKPLAPTLLAAAGDGVAQPPLLASPAAAAASRAWFFAYKLPARRTVYATDPSRSGGLLQRHECVDAWLAAALAAVVPVPLGCLLYNDDPPTERPDGTPTGYARPVQYKPCGHAKGVVVWDSHTVAWLVHSLPRWPCHAAAWPSGVAPGGLSPVQPSQLDRGQSLLLAALPRGQLAAVLRQVRHMQALVYFASDPLLWPHQPRDYSGAQGRGFLEVPLGPGLWHLAKANEPEADFFEELAARRGGRWLVRTNLHTNQGEGAKCASTPSVQNVTTLRVPGLDREPYRAGSEHAKMAVCVGARQGGNPACPLVLVGDLNNTRPQRRRGGGGLLLASQHLNDVLRLMAVEVGFP